MASESDRRYETMIFGIRAFENLLVHSAAPVVISFLRGAGGLGRDNGWSAFLANVCLQEAWSANVIEYISLLPSSSTCRNLVPSCPTFSELAKLVGSF